MLIIHRQLNMEHLQRPGGENRRFVERQMVLDNPLPADQLTGQHQVMDDAVIAGEESGKLLEEFRRRKVSKKSQPPQVHPEQRNLRTAELSTGPQHRAVAAEDKHQIRQRIAEREIISRSESLQHDAGLLGEEIGQLQPSLLDPRTLIAGHHDQPHLLHPRSFSFRGVLRRQFSATALSPSLLYRGKQVGGISTIHCLSSERYTAGMMCLTQLRWNRLRAGIISLVVAVAGGWNLPAIRAADRPPNIVLIIADDLGFSDIGSYGSEIQTPVLDELAARGLRFTQAYNTARCWPTRAALLTGYYAQQVRRDTIPGIKSGTLGVRPTWAPLLPELLKSRGYRSYHAGKWHIDRLPLQTGFDASYSLNDHNRHFYPQDHTEDDQRLPAVPRDSGYHSTAAIAEHAVRQLQRHFAEHPQQPFFSYVAFTAPHFPLQAPADDVARYRPRYLAGWDVMRRQRWSRARNLGVIQSDLSQIERDIGPPYAFPQVQEMLGPDEVIRPIPWSELTDRQRAFQAGKMAVHAAMVDGLDRGIGQIVDELRAQQVLDDTLLLFLSDNGATAEIMVRGDGHDPQAECGTGATFLCLGPGWSSLANTPFRRHKTWVHEGGIATPLVVHWPRGITAGGQLRHTPVHVIDVVPTALALAGIEPPTTWGGAARPKLPGINWLPLFQQDQPQRVTVATESTAGRTLWWSHEGNRAFRDGDWKLVAAGNQAPWELYNLAKDRIESHDLALTFPDREQAMARAWEQQLDQFVRDATPDDAPAANRESSPEK